MDKNEKTFPLQEAPEKNTDHAYVQVGKDGQPVMPETANNQQEEGQKKSEEENTSPHSNA